LRALAFVGREKVVVFTLFHRGNSEYFGGGAREETRRRLVRQRSEEAELLG